MTIPKDDRERLGLFEGQVVAIGIAPVDAASTVGPEITEEPEGGWGEAAPEGEDRNGR